jgi:hypothetical protein
MHHLQSSESQPRMLGEPLCSIGCVDGTCQKENSTSTECAIFVDSREPDVPIDFITNRPLPIPPSICRNPTTEPYSITNHNCLFSANLGTLIPETKNHKVDKFTKCRPHPARGPRVAVQRHPVPPAGLDVHVNVTYMEDTLAHRCAKRVG